MIFACYFFPVYHQCASSCYACSVSPVKLFVTLWTVARHAPLSMGLFRQEYWNGSPFPPPGDLLDPGIEPSSFCIPCTAD